MRTTVPEHAALVLQINSLMRLMLRPRDLVLVTGHLNPPSQIAPAQGLLQVETERYLMEVLARIPWKCRGAKCLSSGGAQRCH